MEFELSDRCKGLRERLLAFMDEYIDPNESVYEEQLRESGDPHFHPPVMEELKEQARARRACGTCSCPTAHPTTRRPGSRTSTTRRSPRSWAAATSPPRRATARRPTPATWRC